MTVFYDDINVNEDILLDLPFREGTGSITQDIAKPHHPVTLVGAPTWTPLASNLMTLNFDGTTQYLECPGADCADLDLTNDVYSIWGWFNWTILDDAQIIIGRYEVDDSGWELYLYRTGSLNLRHHHAGTIVDGWPRSAAYSMGWTPGVDWFFGVVRLGNMVAMVRNGIQQTVLSSTGGIRNAETCTEDLVVGTRFTKNDNFFNGMMWRPRVASGLVTPTRFNQVYDREGVWF